MASGPDQPPAGPSRLADSLARHRWVTAAGMTATIAAVAGGGLALALHDSSAGPPKECGLVPCAAALPASVQTSGDGSASAARHGRSHGRPARAHAVLAAIPPPPLPHRPGRPPGRLSPRRPLRRPAAARPGGGGPRRPAAPPDQPAYRRTGLPVPDRPLLLPDGVRLHSAGDSLQPGPVPVHCIAGRASQRGRGRPGHARFRGPPSPAAPGRAAVVQRRGPARVATVTGRAGWAGPRAGWPGGGWPGGGWPGAGWPGAGLVRRRLAGRLAGPGSTAAGLAAGDRAPAPHDAR